MLTIGHEVVRPGRHWGDSEITIPVPEELETVPGIPKTDREVDWYAREYPLETMNITERASRGLVQHPAATSTPRCARSARSTTSSTAT